MLLVTYDISNNKKRTKFAKFLEEYGSRVQYSVFRVKNSKRVLNIITTTIEKKFAKHFTPEDSVYIFHVCEGCNTKVQKFGYAVYEDQDVVYFN
jgi:CRISPR-associated protein Cas2